MYSRLGTPAIHNDSLIIYLLASGQTLKLPRWPGQGVVNAPGNRDVSKLCEFRLMNEQRE